MELAPHLLIPHKCKGCLDLIRGWLLRVLKVALLIGAGFVFGFAYAIKDCPGPALKALMTVGAGLIGTVLAVLVLAKIIAGLKENG